MPSYAPLEPSSLTSLGVPTPTFDGSASFLATSTFVYSLFFTAIVGAAFYRYVVAGALRMQASEATIRQSNEIIKKVTLGLLGVFSLFLILFTVNKGLVTGDVGLGELQATNDTKSGSTPTSSGSTNTSTNKPNNPGTTSSDEATARAPLLAAGITFNKDGCSSSSQTDCTNIGGIKQDTITMLLKLKSSCGCEVKITGGTEGGHSTNSNHGVGKEAVDISFEESLFTFLKKSGINVGNDTQCNTKYKWEGFIFWDEASGCDSSRNANSARHFHASFTGR